MKAISTLIAILPFALTQPLATLAADEPNSRHETAAKQSSLAVPVSQGEVRKVDKGSGKLTIKHGPLENLGMPAMTMMFRVKDPAMLDQVKEGDKINFTAEKVNGVYTVVLLEIAK